MKSFEQLLISQHDNLQVAIQKLDNNAAHIVLVVDENRKLLGTVTDGDIRRGILRGISLSDPINKAMNHKPVVAKLNEDRNTIYQLMREKHIKQVPLINEMGQVCQIEVLDDLLDQNKKNNIVVLMAGGLSTRLRPLTNDCPKPMLKVGGRPILETIITGLVGFGYHQIYISINYLASQIKEYFGDGSKWGIQIHYLQENDKMGTAGPLSMLPPHIQLPIIVMNSDLLTKVDFNQLMTFHHEQGAVATMCVREFDYTVPYGICKVENNFMVGIEEKPTYKFLINAGVYVLEPKVLQLIPKNVYFDMPNLFSLLIANKQATTAFPIREYWLDIGQLSDFERAHQEYQHVFALETV
ncbi:MAG: nucleotidyltransferase family protein [Candidatus Berkiellales bacterium]